MHKGIRLKLKLWIEGDAEPAQDFAMYTIEAIRQILAAGKTLYPQLQVDIQFIDEDTDWDESEKLDA